MGTPWENSSMIGMMLCGAYAKLPDGSEDDFLYTGYNFPHKIRHRSDLRYPSLSSTPSPLADYLGKGFPDMSFHGERAWFCNMENTSRIIGVMLCGAYAKLPDGSEDDFLYQYAFFQAPVSSHPEVQPLYAVPPPRLFPICQRGWSGRK